MSERDLKAYWRERSKRRREDPEYRAQQAVWNKKWHETKGRTPERLARKAAQMRTYSKDERTAEHHKARQKTRQAIASGKLKRLPCEVCGSTTVHAHHDDYSRPLDVRWLCPKHHAEHHAKALGRTPNEIGDPS